MSNAKRVISSAPSGWRGYTKDTPERAAAREALNTEARDRWDDPTFHAEVASDIADTIYFGFVNAAEQLSQVWDIKVVGEFDREYVRETRGLTARWTARGGQVEESQLTSDVWEIPQDRIGFHVGEEVDTLRAEFSEPLETVANLGEKRMVAEIQRRMFSLMQAAAPSGANNYVSVAGVTKTVIDTGIRQVREAVQAVIGADDAPVTVAGRATIMDELLDFNLGFDPDASQEIRSTGRLAVYRAANLLWLKNFVDEDGASYLPANELYIFAGSAGRFRLFGGVFVKTWEENTVDYRHYRGTQKAGGIIIHPELVRRVVDTNIAA